MTGDAFPAERLPWRCEPAAGGSGWVIVRDAAGEFVARVTAEYGPWVAALPDLAYLAGLSHGDLKDVLDKYRPEGDR